MDFNNDGKVDHKDQAIFHSEISNSGGGSSGGSGSSGGGCLMWFVIGALALQVFQWFIKLFS